MKTNAREPSSASTGHDPPHVEANHHVPDLIVAIGHKIGGYDEALSRPPAPPELPHRWTCQSKDVGYCSTALKPNQQGDDATDTVGLLVVLEAKAGKEDDLAGFLAGALPLVQDEPQTTAWFAARLDATRFAIFDAFPDEAGRDAHLSGQVAAALMEQAPELLAQTPTIERAEILAEKLP